ncbi:MAG TPA: D-alanyl-D-alanine carboxypeptidase family protein [Chloroflexota bacterium]|nr:D-alanyl-D-alanine carboxypeptidase family protein [Chloroflexota bacterium]
MHSRKLALTGLIILIGFCLVGFGPPALIGSDRVASAVDADTLTQANIPPVPEIQAGAAAVVDGDNGRIVWGKNPHQSWPPASMTKMMTALVTLEHGNLDQVVTSNVDASKLVGDSVMGLHPGERLTLRQLLFGLLIPSGDDAAMALAPAVAGSEPQFVALMNQQASALGLTDTHFVNEHGLDAPGHLSSPYDMIAIGRAAMRYPLFRQIVSTQHTVIQGQWKYDLTNTNYFLGRRPDVIGIKTGSTDLAGHVITVAEERSGHILYITVMHTPNYVPDVTALLDYYDTHDEWVPLALPDTPLNVVSRGSSTGHLHVDSDLTMFLPRWQGDHLQTQLNLTPDSPLRATDNPDLPDPNAGIATFYAGGEPLARLPLVVK